jgi:hypothetical protein
MAVSGLVLTIDLTNRCNMMCDPAVIDAVRSGTGMSRHSTRWSRFATGHLQC